MIGLLGGSFDPIHHGHLIVAQSVFEQLKLSELRFVVAREQPLKQGHGAPADHRARMVALAIAGAPHFRLETLELDREGPSYTIDTLRALRRREPEAQFTLFLGSDAAGELDRWREASEVARLARIVVFGRAGETIPASPLIAARVGVPAIELSATEVRTRAREGKPVRYWVPDPVAEYIRQNRLYL